MRLWTVVLEISVLMAQFPSKQIAQLSYEFRTLGLGYANIGGLLMSSGIAYDCDEGRAICGALTAIMTGVSYATSAEMAAKLGAVPRLREEPRAHAARDAQPPPRRVRRTRAATRSSRTPPVPLDHALAAPTRRWSSTPRRAWDHALAPRRGARLPQRAGDRDRADRHDRPGDGLRHHRHRARLRAGEVQEARRRRLLQDHQPRGAGSACARSATREAEIDEIEAYAVGHGSLVQRARHQPRDAAAPRASPTKRSQKVEKALPTAFDIKFAFNKWTLGEEFCVKTLGIDRPSIAQPDLRPARPRSASPSARSKPPTSTSAAR